MTISILPHISRYEEKADQASKNTTYFVSGLGAAQIMVSYLAAVHSQGSAEALWYLLTLYFLTQFVIGCYVACKGVINTFNTEALEATLIHDSAFQVGRYTMLIISVLLIIRITVTLTNVLFRFILNLILGFMIFVQLCHYQEVFVLNRGYSSVLFLTISVGIIEFASVLKCTALIGDTPQQALPYHTSQQSQAMAMGTIISGLFLVFHLTLLFVLKHFHIPFSILDYLILMLAICTDGLSIAHKNKNSNRLTTIIYFVCYLLFVPTLVVRTGQTAFAFVVSCNFN